MNFNKLSNKIKHKINIINSSQHEIMSINTLSVDILNIKCESYIKQTKEKPKKIIVHPTFIRKMNFETFGEELPLPITSKFVGVEIQLNRDINENGVVVC
jgi:hypothetical protein